MNSITIAGRIGKDAVIRATAKGESVAGFSVGTDVGYGDKKQTLWFDCSIWGKRAESLANHLTKGSSVTVIGELSTREHEGKTYLSVRVSEIALQGGKKAESQDGWEKPSKPQAPSNDADPFGDDVPF